MAAIESCSGGGGGDGEGMGRGRAVVAAVLSIISLAVLSLHVALCLHYPSPLFAVTLLLNPSLWMLLGAVGMGCALALTYRERQRKVRAALCTTCHTRYGATVDGKWREGVAPRPRGPSRAVYAYNGISHKFYASYGAMSEKPGAGVKHPAVLHKGPAPPIKQDSPSSCSEGTPLKTPPEPDKDGTGGDPKAVTGVKEAASPGQDTSLPDPSSAPHTDATTTPAGQDSPETTSLPSQSNGDKKSSASAAPGEKLACNCLSRYGGMSHRVRERAHREHSNGGAARRRQGQPEVRTVGKYHKRLLMQCQARDPKDVPVHLFTTSSSVSATQDTVPTSTVPPATTTSVDVCSESRPLLPRGITDAVVQSRGEDGSTPMGKEAAPDPGCNPPPNTATQRPPDSLPPASTRAPSRTPAPRPPSPGPPSRPSPSPPLTPAAEGNSSGDSAHDAFQTLQDPEVASMSSECGLLPSSEESNAPPRSPLWGALASTKRERRSEERQADRSRNRPPLSSLLATTRRVLARPRWTRQEDRTPPALQLSPSSPRKRRVPGAATGGRLWRQQKQSPARPMTSLGAEGAENTDSGGAGGSGVSQANSPDGGSPSTPARPRERKVRRTRPRPRHRDPAGDSVLLLSDDATEE
ncbi:serine/arginine repetitive matrix protein 1-like [Scylla paramamosain]